MPFSQTLVIIPFWAECSDCSSCSVVNNDFFCCKECKSDLLLCWFLIVQGRIQELGLFWKREHPDLTRQRWVQGRLPQLRGRSGQWSTLCREPNASLCLYVYCLEILEKVSGKLKSGSLYCDLVRSQALAIKLWPVQCAEYVFTRRDLLTIICYSPDLKYVFPRW